MIIELSNNKVISIVTIILLLLLVMWVYYINYINSKKIGIQYFGPLQWKVLHSIISKYDPDTQKESMRAYLYSLQDLLPCDKCRNDYIQRLKKNSFEQYLDSREKLFRWAYNLHDEVNISNNKVSPSYESVKSYYETKMNTQI
ncbi:MAG: ERV1/ALR-related protein [Propionibacteriaceae bacterium]|nr:ERV1/ALR-related protein [Propionibacteriaceae bacterium]